MSQLSIAGMLLLFSLALTPGAGWGDVVASDRSGFQIRIERTVAIPADRVYAAFTEGVSGWWSSDHTWSGQAANLSMDLKAGRFIERLPNGGFCEHMRIVHHQPGEVLRMTGGMGPLQELGLDGAMTLRLTPAGEKTRVELVYSVSGFAPGVLEQLPAGVDAVLTLQIDRFHRYCETGDPEKTGAEKPESDPAAGGDRQIPLEAAAFPRD